MRPRAAGPRAETWDRYWGGKAEVAQIYPAVSDLVAQISRALPELAGRRVLEVGAGTGREAERLVALGARVWALDFSTQALRLARQGSSGGEPSGVHWIRGDALASPFPDGSFDLVYHQGLLEHFRDPMPLLRENYRLLRPGGWVLVDVPQKYHLYTALKHALMALDRWFAGWETEFSPGEIRRVVERAGFVPRWVYGYGMRPGLWYRVLRELLGRAGVRLPLEPALGPLGVFYRGWHRLVRRLEETRFGPYLTLTVGVVAQRPD